jgi:hypothetical protein
VLQSATQHAKVTEHAGGFEAAVDQCKPAATFEIRLLASVGAVGVKSGFAMAGEQQGQRRPRSKQRRQRFAPKLIEQTIEMLAKTGFAVNKLTVCREGFTVDTAKPSETMKNGEVLTPDDELERWRKKKNAD